MLKFSAKYYNISLTYYFNYIADNVDFLILSSSFTILLVFVTARIFLETQVVWTQHQCVGKYMA